MHMEPSLVRSRVAVAVFFAVNGMIGFTFLPRLAQVQNQTGLDDAGLGIVLAIGTAGGLIVGPAAAYFVTRFGATQVTAVTLLVSLPAIAAIGFVNSGVALALVLAVWMSMDALTDSAMNTRALALQSAYGRSIINSFHAWWSLAMIIGSALGALSAVVGLSLPSFLTGMALVSAGIVMWAWRADTANVPLTHVAHSPLRLSTLPLLVRSGVGIVLGFIVLAVIVEDVPVRWGAIYLAEIGQGAAVIGLAYVAVTGGQTIGRFFGDRLVDRWGQASVIRISMGVVAVSITSALIQGSAAAFIGAVALSGLGVATLFPAAMNAAAQLPGISPALGIAVVSWFSRVGFVIAPLAVGLIAEGAGLRYGLAIMVIAAIGLVAIAGRVDR